MNTAATFILLFFASSPLLIEPAATVDFRTEIIPILTKSGCNSGACHGAAAGRGGFRLSLWGSDSNSDFAALVEDLEGRRVNLAKPSRSLVLTKPTGQLEHGGKVLFSLESPEAVRLKRWIEQGAPLGETRALKQFQITPDIALIHEVPAEIKLTATATFDSQQPIDVTEWVTFVPADPDSISIDPVRHVAQLKRRGQQFIIARFLDQVVPIRFDVPLNGSDVDVAKAQPQQDLSNKGDAIEFQSADKSGAGVVDQEVGELLMRMRIPPSPICDDATFLRRVRLDLTGRLPSPEEVEDFLKESPSDKRVRLVDRLLTSPEFVEFWTLRIARWLHLHSLTNEPESAKCFADWIHERLSAGSGLDEMARDLILATGDSHEVGAANFSRMVSDARQHAERISEVFLGARMGCANCHNHPLDRWTQDDYHGLAAVFAKVERGRIVQLGTRGAVTHPATHEPATPRIPGVRDLPMDGDHRTVVADWILNDPQMYFAQAMVNRLWQSMMGRGLVEPVDDFRQTNPPTHPELLRQLAVDFVAHGFDLRYTLRQISLSSTYQRTAETSPLNESDDRFYSHAFQRSLLPEVLADAIYDVTDVPFSFPDQALGTRAIAIVDPLVPSAPLDALGRCSQVKNCNGESDAHHGVSEMLELINGELINFRVIDEQGRLKRMFREGNSSEMIVNEFYLRAFSRNASEDEVRGWKKSLESSNDQERRAKLEDFVWALLNSREFQSNH
jgi:Protein of unknown function (DUF1549)/Protein of unknown function (DUF1553)